jgi:hypothetical protein
MRSPPTAPSACLLGSTSLGSASVGAEDARLGPNGQTLWVVETGARGKTRIRG